MLQNIFETIIKGSSTEFLDVPEDDYFLCYEGVSMECAEDIVKNYFDMKAKDGIPHVKDIEYNSATHKVKITVEVEQSGDKEIHAREIPDVLNINRY